MQPAGEGGMNFAAVGGIAPVGLRPLDAAANTAFRNKPGRNPLIVGRKLLRQSAPALCLSV